MMLAGQTAHVDAEHARQHGQREKDPGNQRKDIHDSIDLFRLPVRDFILKNRSSLPEGFQILGQALVKDQVLLQREPIRGRRPGFREHRDETLQCVPLRQEESTQTDDLLTNRGEIPSVPGRIAILDPRFHAVERNVEVLDDLVEFLKHVIDEGLKQFSRAARAGAVDEVAADIFDSPHVFAAEAEHAVAVDPQAKGDHVVGG